MISDRVKFPKQQLASNSLQDFVQIARFSRPKSSLYQALIIGIIELIIRFKHSPKYLEPFNRNFRKMIKEAYKVSSSNFGLESFEKFIDFVTSADITNDFLLLNRLTENDPIISLNCDDVMKSLICSALIGNFYIQNSILKEEPLENIDVLLYPLVCLLKIKISLYENEQETIYVSPSPGNYPSINLLKEGDNYSLLYTKEMIEIEYEPSFDFSRVEYQPFIYFSQPKIVPTGQDYEISEEIVCFKAECPNFPIYLCSCTGKKLGICKDHFDNHLNLGTNHKIVKNFKKITKETKFKLKKTFKNVIQSIKNLKTQAVKNTSEIIDRINENLIKYLSAIDNIETKHYKAIKFVEANNKILYKNKAVQTEIETLVLKNFYTENYSSSLNIKEFKLEIDANYIIQRQNSLEIIDSMSKGIYERGVYCPGLKIKIVKAMEYDEDLRGLSNVSKLLEFMKE